MRPVTQSKTVTGIANCLARPDTKVDPTLDGRPLVTIAIPTFNRAPLLKRCIESALTQTYEHFEILVSDNASSDNTDEIVCSFDDPRLRVIRQQTNIGQLPNWNACLAAAKGDYVVVVSDDDSLEPWLLERCVAVVQKDPEIPIVIALSHLHVTSMRRTIAARTSRRLRTGLCDGTDILLEFLRNELGTVAASSIMFRTSTLRAAGGFPLNFPHAADIAAWAPLLFLGRAGLVNEACATWYSHDNSATARMSVEQLLIDAQELANLISALADTHITDPVKRRAIQSHSHRCFAGRGLTALSQYRRNGGRVQAIARYIWQFRHLLRSVDLTAAVKLMVTIVCPRPLVHHVRRLAYLVSSSSLPLP
jgi:glycosyltransferase involved in cell wall biosynthesis